MIYIKIYWVHMNRGGAPLIAQLVNNLPVFLGQEDPLEKGIGYPIQYSWASLVAQIVKNPASMLESCVQTLGWGDPLEEGMTTHSSILVARILTDREAWWTIAHGVAKNQT